MVTGSTLRRPPLRRLSPARAEACVKTFQDIQSGSNDQREGLWKAVEAAGKAKATLVVSKLDRLSRSGIRFMVDLDRQRRVFTWQPTTRP